MKLQYFQVLHFLLIALFFTVSCSPNKNTPEDNVNKRVYLAEKNPISIIVLEKKDFSKQLVSNGKLHALRKSELSFSKSEIVATLPYKNGTLVGRGSIIATLEQRTQKLALEEGELALKKASLDLEDFLISQGYELKDSANIPVLILEAAMIKTGYSSALQELEKVQEELRSMVLIAPFTGKIASISTKQYEYPKSNEPFCILIDDSEFEVDFQVTESELQELSIGMDVKIIPFAKKEDFNGKIIAINPLVNEHGLVTVLALVKNTGGLLEGMNVKVLVEKQIPNQLIVPKSAVVIRQNQDVLFKVVDGKAAWTYLQIMYENSDSYAVTAHSEKQASLEPGDSVIVSGNLNLAHESEVEVKE